MGDDSMFEEWYRDEIGDVKTAAEVMMRIAFYSGIRIATQRQTDDLRKWVDEVDHPRNLTAKSKRVRDEE